MAYTMHIQTSKNLSIDKYIGAIETVGNDRQWLTYSSVKPGGLLADGSAERRNGLFKESLTSSLTSSVMVAEKSIVCLLLGHKRTCKSMWTHI